MEFHSEDPSGHIRPDIDFGETTWLPEPYQDVNRHVSFELSSPAMLSVDNNLFQPTAPAVGNSMPFHKANRVVEERVSDKKSRVKEMWRDAPLGQFTWGNSPYMSSNPPALQTPLANFETSDEYGDKGRIVSSVAARNRFISSPSIDSPDLDSSATTASSSSSSVSECCLETDCALNCGEDCDDACDDDCSQHCTEDCQDDCDDCTSCISCEPCVNSQCPQDTSCTVSLCYKPNCYETDKQISSLDASSMNTNSFIQPVEPNLFTFTSSYSLQYPYQMPTTGPTEDHFTNESRLAKRRKPNSHMQLSVPADQTQSALGLSQPFADDHSNYFCHWGPSCDAGFVDHIALDAHVLQTHLRPQADFTCHWEACGEAEKDFDTLLSHVRESHANRENTNEHVCLWEGCNSTFGNSDDLSKHLSTNHLNPIGDIMCQWESCGTYTSGLQALTTHLHTDHLKISRLTPCIETTPEGALACQWTDNAGGEVCNKIFSSAEALQSHLKDAHIAKMQKKTGYFCQWANCGRRDKAFSQKGKVERHMQTHTGFKSCRCEFCHKEFSAPQALQQHIRTHTGEKPYKCDICGKEFAQGSAMTMHKRVHTGERPLQCDFPGCGKRFSESSNLSKHRKTHNPVGQHKCDFEGCQRTFHRVDQLKRHQKTHGILTSLSNSNPP